MKKHEAVLHLIPTSPCRVLDIGAGTGADAAWLAGNGHHVVAVEPTKELRIPAMALHCSNLIDWIDDSLPNLTITKSKSQSFDLIMLTSVWMHLDEYERLLAMPNLLSLLASGGVILMSLRHGPLFEYPTNVRSIRRRDDLASTRSRIARCIQRTHPVSTVR
ncbi:class I SAM-dependent methyltransferase [Undibacterium arcticum]